MKLARIHQKPEEVMADDTQALKEIMLRVEESLKQAIPLGDAKKVVVKGRDGKPGEAGKTPQKGVDYFTEEELNAIKDEVYSRIKPPQDGFSPVAGVHYPTFEQIQTIVKQNTPQLPPTDTPEEIVEKINVSEKRIKAKQVEGLSAALRFVDEYGTNPGGGGAGRPIRFLDDGTVISDHVTEINFSTNLTPTYSGNGRITLSATGGAGGGYTNLTEFIDQTAWRIFYSNASGDVTELALGSSGTILTSNGASSAPTWETAPAGYTNLTQFIAQTAWRIFYSDASGDVQELALGSAGTVLQSAGASSIPTWNSLPANYTNLTEFVDQTAWRVFYSNGSGDVTELALGSSGTVLTSNGASSAPTFSAPTTNGLVKLTATGSINASNVTFTFTSVPDYIVSDGVIMPATAAGGGVNWTNSGLTITMVNPPTWDIYGLSNIAVDTTSVVYTTGNQSIDGTKTFTTAPVVPDEAYGVSWNGNNAVPTKNAVYDKIETISVSGGLTWSEVTGTSQAGAVNNAYIVNNASLVTVTIPDTAAVGSVIRIVGKGAGGWKIAQNASENIRFGSSVTTTGTGGSLDSTNQYDCVEIVCTVADTTWTVMSSVGNITVT